MSQLTEKQRITIIQLLGGFAPHARLFGSRAAGTAGPWSDVDICIIAPISLAEMGALREAMEASTLPLVVDLCRYEDLAPAFRQQVDAEGLPLVEVRNND